jgi:hypothetical protein
MMNGCFRLFLLFRCRVRDGELGPTANTTGLGLPLSRALACAGGGWLSLDEVEEVQSAPSGQPGSTASTPAISSTAIKSPATPISTEPVELTTHYWCVMVRACTLRLYYNAKTTHYAPCVLCCILAQVRDEGSRATVCWP